MRGRDRNSILVAGGATGIGAAAAERLGQEGTKVVNGDVNRPRAEQTAQRLRDSGADALAIEVDITDEDSVRELIELSVATYGRPDGMHADAADSNGGTFGRDGDATEVRVEVWDRAAREATGIRKRRGGTLG